ncbi:AraC family transcriptional regulator [Myroides sp. M-43]|uniref:helix-turn-helix domain-containing protein n=1 Tax=Myroides oncorhynchi TaxID=2893756 RepID=UPI001E2B0633|nr:AraC family transcriptional regulator [Myroides oncorhynchi]MCC9041263.1 AraC family transcriptional regulator [Myroides oncorhynchi]
MKSIRLPQDLVPTLSEQIIIYDYLSTQEVSKQQVSLSQNTFSFLIEGTKEVVHNNANVAIDSSKFILMQAGHCLMTERLSTINNYRSILLFFTNEAILNFLIKNNIPYNNIANHNSVHTFNYDDFIRRFAFSLLDINKLNNPTKNKLLTLKLEEILLYLIELYSVDFLLSFTINNNNQIQKFTQTIESNILNKLTLNELAFLCNMSLSSFKREFKKHYAESPSRWFQSKRLEYAHTLLSQKNKTVSEIYLEIGYESASSFIQAYKAKYGTTPTQHRKK